MAGNDDLIDFGVIEDSKENIQSIPGGRSAKQLSLLLSPSQNRAHSLNTPFSQTQELKATIRADFEKEIQNIDEADDPLDVYDRYVKWTTNAFPSVQATPESGLLSLLERATQSLIGNEIYKNDPRYLKIWLLYIRLVSDSPQETYAFLSRHGIGAGLALYYEEFAAWLETQGHWTQAEEVYCVGVDKEARPKERLLRKYAEFQHRREVKTTDEEGPSSPALPQLRPALALRNNTSSAAADADPQAADRRAAQPLPKTTRSGNSKMTIFSDEEAQPSGKGTIGPGPSWDSIGSLADRKKENVREATSWAGEKLDGGKRLAGPKMTVFKDTSLAKFESENPIHPKTFYDLDRISVDAKGRKQYVYADLESIYPHGVGERTEEFCFEELRAKRRGWLDKPWIEMPLRPVQASMEQHEVESTCHLNLPMPQPDSKVTIPTRQELVDLSDENRPLSVFPAQTLPLKDSTNAAVRRAMREDKANKTRKIKIVQVEIKQEAQTVQLNLDSPSGPKKIRKIKPEATMTIHTKEAMDDVYDIFNQPLKPQGNVTTEIETNASEEEDEDDEDDYTSAGESTGTGRISVGTSEYGDETIGDITISSRTEEAFDPATMNSVSDTEFSGYSENTHTSVHLAAIDSDEDDLSKVSISQDGNIKSAVFDAESFISSTKNLTPTSPHVTDAFFDQATDIDDRHGYSTMPYRIGQAAGRLPFMTPIVEKTESSVGALTVAADRNYACLKTPSRQNNNFSMSDIDDEEETGPLSSPFQETTDHESAGAAVKMCQPALTRLSIKSKLAEEAPEVAADEASKDAIIPDVQCNPIDLGVRDLIISKLHPPLCTYTGFSDKRGSSANMSARIRKFTKSASEKRPGAEATSLPLQLDFLKSSRAYSLRRELGRGAFAPVYLVDSQAREDARGYDSGPKRSNQEVIKMEDPPTPWEFYIISQAHRRIGLARPSQSIVAVHEMHLYDDECYLVEEYRNQGTLLDAINLYRVENAGMDEQLVMFVVIELLRTVEALHAKGLIHGDLKPDNILMRLGSNDTVAETWDSQYHRDGDHGWSTRGILLIDFGRGIDMRNFRSDVQFIADWKTSEGDCAEMREMRPWTYQVDYHGLAGTVHSLLFGRYMEIVAEKNGALGAGAIKTYKIKEGLKRYWQTEIWARTFDILLNPLCHTEQDAGRLPVISKLRMLRESMEIYLAANCEKGVGLKPLIRRLENALKERKR